MKLSIAIRMGSLLIHNPEASKWDRCAFGMASLASGGSFAGTEYDVARAISRDVYEKWPWLIDFRHDCPKCGKRLYGGECVWHLFDRHIMPGGMTMEQLADFVSSIEPAEVLEPQAPAVETTQEVTK